ncbi:MAG: hypothetical protein VYC39_19580 [Myxococcota bacterium]|nr:hypothetical protein [Myxococcota bacterium]
MTMSDKKSERPRFVSKAGPSIPVTNKKTDDVVPPGSGWLEGPPPRSGGFVDEEAQQQQMALSELLKASREERPHKEKSADDEIQSRSAISLVEQLAAQSPEPAPLTEARKVRTAQVRAISAVKIEGPAEEAPKRRLPLSVWVAVMAVTVIVIAAVAWNLGFKEPAPESARDHSALKEKIGLREKAVQMVNQGHELAVRGPKSAKKAIEAYRQALTFDPELASAHKGLGSVLMREKDVKAAIRHYETYLKLVPEAPDADAVRAILDKHTDDPMRPKGGIK